MDGGARRQRRFAAGGEGARSRLGVGAAPFFFLAPPAVSVLGGGGGDGAAAAESGGGLHRQQGRGRLLDRGGARQRRSPHGGARSRRLRPLHSRLRPPPERPGGVAAGRSALPAGTLGQLRQLREERRLRPMAEQVEVVLRPLRRSRRGRGPPTAGEDQPVLRPRHRHVEGAHPLGRLHRRAPLGDAVEAEGGSAEQLAAPSARRSGPPPPAAPREPADCLWSWSR